jgi:hypothetical protein
MNGEYEFLGSTLLAASDDALGLETRIQQLHKTPERSGNVHENKGRWRIMNGEYEFLGSTLLAAPARVVAGTRFLGLRNFEKHLRFEIQGSGFRQEVLETSLQHEHAVPRDGTK